MLERWPAPGMTTSSAPGMAACRSLADERTPIRDASPPIVPNSGWRSHSMRTVSGSVTRPNSGSVAQTTAIAAANPPSTIRQ